MEAIDTVAMQELTVDWYPTGIANVTGLVSATGESHKWYETVVFSGYYCDDEDCPDDEYEECQWHPGDYWRDEMKRQWLVNIRERHMHPVVDPALVLEELRQK